MPGRLRAGRQGAAGDRGVHAACPVPVRGLRLQIGMTGRGEQRTTNMWFMSVTREVSQAEMSALKLRKL